MASSNTGPKPYRGDLPGGGTAAIMVPLIIGGALLVGVYILWDSHVRIARQAEMSRMEEEIRHDLVIAYRALVNNEPEKAMRVVGEIEERAGIFKGDDDIGYSDIRAARLILEGQAVFMLLCDEGAPAVEQKFTDALGLLMRASGEMWEFGMMGRARARIGQGKFEEARDDLDILLVGNPNYGAGYYWRSIAKAESGDMDGAREDEEKARRLDSWPPRRNLLQNSCPAGLEPAL